MKAKIFKINYNSKLEYAGQSPVLVDPSRRMLPISKPKVFNREDIEMYHMSYVRKNILTKILNSSARSSFTHIQEFINLFESYKVGEPLFTSAPPCNETTTLVDNIFEINL